MKRKFLRSLGLFLTCGVAVTALASCGKKTKKVVTPEKEGYNILWSDEFNGKKLDESIWHREEREKGWTNNELQMYTSDTKNGFVKDGKFVIKAYEETVGSGSETSTYSSCKLRANDDHAFKYGRIEVNAKSPEGLGLWPAVWMMPKVQEHYGEWPTCGEIDIMEVLGDNVTKAYGTLHYGVPHAEQQGTVELTNGKTFANDFHEYAIEWEPGKIEWFIDGQSYLVVNDWFSSLTEDGDEYPFPAPFNQDFCIQINLAVGGNWPGNPEPGADYIKNAEFEIDYVRVYQKAEYDENVKKPEVEYRKPDETGNYITSNRVDDANQVGWVYHQEDTGSGSVTAIENGFKIVVNKSGKVNYSVQLFHTAMPFIKGKTYKISFDIKADADFVINEVCIDAPNAGWSRYWKNHVKATTEEKPFEATFTMTKKSDNGARFEFNVGNSDTGTLYITNIRVEEVTE